MKNKTRDYNKEIKKLRTEINIWLTIGFMTAALLGTIMFL